ncbi:hypothetical protein HN873_043010, partial [Arachis hypogaea]
MKPKAIILSSSPPLLLLPPAIRHPSLPLAFHSPRRLRRVSVVAFVASWSPSSSCQCCRLCRSLSPSRRRLVFAVANFRCYDAFLVGNQSSLFSL